MDASVAVPPEVQNEVAKELDLIARHEGIAVSPLMNMGGSLDPVNSLKAVSYTHLKSTVAPTTPRS